MTLKSYHCVPKSYSSSWVSFSREMETVW